jgi:FAD/FMN-containing dehydrogenase
MKRRSFCGAALSSAALAALPESALLAASATDLRPTDIDELRASLTGQLLLPEQQEYESARKVWNGAFDRKPALIARCSNTNDVIHAVGFARQHRLVSAVRGGGHSFAGHSTCDGGLLIDLSEMDGIHVDAKSRTARVQPGVVLGQFDRETQARGLATTMGTVSLTGVGGLTLGGGFGRLARRFGLACDNLIGAEMVSADGRVVTASTSENSDLLWALRGGGGNFGIVTSFEYQLHSVAPAMHGGLLVFPFTQPRALLRSYADFIAGASDELFVMFDIVPTPNGRIAALEVCHSGSKAAAERELAALRKVGKPLNDAVGPATYVALQRGIDKDYPAGRGYYLKSGFIRTITPALIDTLVGYLDAAPWRRGVASFIQHGGAIARVKPDATAYWHREAGHTVLLVGTWDEAADAERSTQWTRTGWGSLEPQTEGFYLNFMAPDDSDRRILRTYAANYARLTAIKKRYDPTNVFKLNANIKPA